MGKGRSGQPAWVTTFVWSISLRMRKKKSGTTKIWDQRSDLFLVRAEKAFSGFDAVALSGPHLPHCIWDCRLHWPEGILGASLGLTWLCLQPSSAGEIADGGTAHWCFPTQYPGLGWHLLCPA